MVFNSIDLPKLQFKVGKLEALENVMAVYGDMHGNTATRLSVWPNLIKKSVNKLITSWWLSMKTALACFFYTPLLLWSLFLFPVLSKPSYFFFLHSLFKLLWKRLFIATDSYLQITVSVIVVSSLMHSCFDPCFVFI